MQDYVLRKRSRVNEVKRQAVTVKFIVVDLGHQSGNMTHKYVDDFIRFTLLNLHAPD